MSDIKDVMHETAKGQHKVGGLSLTTMREIDALRLPPIKKYSAVQIKRLRVRNKASQSVFAAFLNMALQQNL
ncbi:MAG: transcriptional regulator, partial [Pseudomonadales bacterium]|nr:transcriptional regulator [Pseudomonadales bacterium]